MALPHAEDFASLPVRAQQEAARLGHRYVGTEHLLLALASNNESLASRALVKAGLGPDDLRDELAVYAGASLGASDARQIPISPRVKRVLEDAESEATARDAEEVACVHALLAVSRDPDGVAGQILESAGIDYKVIERCLKT